jgi:hypothetical protein
MFPFRSTAVSASVRAGLIAVPVVLWCGARWARRGIPVNRESNHMSSDIGTSLANRNAGAGLLTSPLREK